MTSDSLLQGLASIDVGPTIAGVTTPSMVIDLSSVLDDAQVQSLISGLGGNALANRNADEITRQLQVRGILNPNERIVGARNGILYKSMR